ncbi:unnamed protein product, partial [Symbiodinium sp. CCMP2592]
MCLERGRGVGLPSAREGGRSGSTTIAPLGGSRPGCRGPWQLGHGDRNIAGDPGTDAFVQSARSVLSHPRQPPGRTQPPLLEGSGRLFGKTEQTRQANQCCRGGRQGQRSPPTPGVQGQGKGKGEGRQDRVNPPGEPPTLRLPGARAPTVSVPGFWCALPSWILRGRGRFSRFFRSLLRGSNKAAPTSQVWPCPVPYPEVFRAGAHASSPWRKKQACLIVGLLSWLHLGSPAEAPPGLGLGTPLSAKQWRMVRVLEHLAWDSEPLLRLDAPAMGRTASKVEDQDEILAALARAAASLEGSCNYTAPARAGSRSFANGPSLDFGSPLGPLLRAELISAKAIQADRLRFLGSPSFDPGPYLDPATLARYQRPFDFAQPPNPSLAPPPRVQVLASPAERRGLFKKLAATGRLLPVTLPESRLPYAAGLFSVLKDMQRDRLILDSRPANVLERPPHFWTSSLCSSAALLQIVLEPTECLRINAADLRDFFYFFQVTGERLQRNIIKAALTPAEAAEVFDFDCSSYVGRDGKVRVGLSTLAMGDSSACEFAQGSHLAVLFRHGALAPSELLLPSFPPPRGLLSIGVVIDDLIILERCLDSSVSDPRLPSVPEGRSESLGGARLDAAHAAYRSARLEANLDKGARDVSTLQFWGSLLDGKRGLLRTAPGRLWPLAFITARVATLGLVTHHLLQSLVGSWTSVFLLRRRCLSTFELCFAALRGTPDTHVLRLSPALIDELWSWVLLGPVCVANLRAPVLDELYATDASDHLLAAVAAPLPPRVAKEAYRHCLVKGAWSRLLPQGQALLRARESLPSELELPEGDAYTPHPLWRKLGCSLRFRTLAISEGRYGQHINAKELKSYLQLERLIAGRHSSVRLLALLDSQVALACVLKGRSSSPSLNSLLRRSLPVMLGADLYAGLGFVKSEDNVADDPTRHRTPREPAEDLPPWFASLAAGDCEAFDAWLALQALQQGFEGTSLTPPLPAFAGSTSAGPHLQCKVKREGLGVAGTKVGWGLPRGFGYELAFGAARSAAWVGADRLPASQLLLLRGLLLSAAIARVGCARPGEATNPGPRRVQPRARGPSLESRPLLGEQSLSLGEQGWSSFLSWSSSRLSLELFSRSAALLAMALRAYGNWLFSNDGSLYSLRHTLLAAQRKFLELKPYAKVVWELITRWEHAEPPVHRTPVPEPILKAVVCVAWLHGYLSFAGVTLLAYYGLGRIGEVLACTRADLLLPSDDLWDQSRSVFLRLGASKTTTRGRPRVQHLKVIDPTAVVLISAVFSSAARSQPLFAQSSAAYRYRWNKILRWLNLAPELRLTPGGLRGGGAVEAYRKGIPVTEIQWRMRLKHLHTLEFYLQELGAESALAALNSSSTTRVRS